MIARGGAYSKLPLHGLAPLPKLFLKKGCFSGFVVKKHKFLVLEGLALCLIIYQILIISMMACFSV